MSVSQVNPTLQVVPFKSTPVSRWCKALEAVHEEGAMTILRGIYQDMTPKQGEIIFTGACDFACRHCIYPPDYGKLNRGLPPDEWVFNLVRLNRDLGVNSFVYGGRAVTRAGVEMLMLLRNRLPESRIGLIDNGLSVAPHQEALEAIQPDWIDFSFDGMPADHDSQRERRGSFKAALEGALDLMQRKVTTQINVLTCLTSLNRHSVVHMIRYLNAQGFKNFFVTPVTIVDGVRPATELAVSPESLTQFLDEVDELAGSLEGAYVEVGLFDAKYMEAITHLQTWRSEGFYFEEDHLAWVREEAGNSRSVRYFPSSLTAIREFIINTNGDVILPKAMAWGRVPREKIIGNLTSQSPGEIWEQMPRSNVFQTFTDELIEERRLLCNYMKSLGGK